MKTLDNETRREFSAVPVVLGISALGIAVLVGIRIGSAGANVTVVLPLIAIVALVVWAIRSAAPSAADPPQAAAIDDSRYRILLVADDRGTASWFVDELRSRAGELPLSVFVMAPTLGSRLGRLAEDQGVFDDASERLTGTLDGLREAGIQVDGEVSESNPLQAADDGLRQFPADEIIFVTQPDDRANWLEQGVVELAESRYAVPVRHFPASPQG
jgi:hypothetical protein